jgi:7-carboxy-7-deazaguanine synthase
VNDNLALINCIYLATEGEGVRIGTPQIFVRFQGCTVGCINCDSKETWNFETANKLSLDQIIAQVKELSNGKYHQINTVSITGGDPLHPKHVPMVEALVYKLKEMNYFINIEASGTRIVKSIFDKVDFISFDYKTPSTAVRMRNELLLELVNQYAGKYQIKSVVYDQKDFDVSYEVWHWLNSNKLSSESLNWVLTPCYNNQEAFPTDRFKKIIDWNQEFGAPFRVIGQQHKWLHGPDRTQI